MPSVHNRSKRSLKNRLRTCSENSDEKKKDSEIGSSSFKFFSYHELQQHASAGLQSQFKNERFVFEDYSTLDKIKSANRRGNFIFCPHLPLALLDRLQRRYLRQICSTLDIVTTEKTTIQTLRKLIRQCNKILPEHGLIFKLYKKRVSTEPKHGNTNRPSENAFHDKSFPPDPPTKKLQETIVNGWCDDIESTKISEQGCSVCGTLTPLCELVDKDDLKNIDFTLLDPAYHPHETDVTRKERKVVDDPISTLDGPIIDQRLHGVCEECVRYLRRKKVPPFSMASGFWLGDVPDQLSCLGFAEKLLIARARSNNFIIKVKSGRYKLRGNAITFPSPVSKVYDMLPPHRSELEQILACIFVGPQKPTPEDLNRVPLLVRKNKVVKALEWLRLNHVDYADVGISSENLASYSDNEIPVSVAYHPGPSNSNKEPESTAVFDDEPEDGVENGMCPFIVHGLTVEQLQNLEDLEIMKAVAVRGLQSGQGVLAIGRSEEPERTFLNPQLYPKMFPWLFPYGFGGPQNLRGSPRSKQISDVMWKRRLLMYHDKRFQRDRHFPLVALNHEQLKQSSTGAHLMTQRASFPDVIRRIANVNADTLSDLATRLKRGELVTPNTEDERVCYQLINDVDVVAHKVYGSLTSKRFMRNEIWSLACCRGAPTWFITFAPPDNKNPICLFFADDQETFELKLRSYDERYRLIAENPVASARYFNFMVGLFIKHILGVDTNHAGLFGVTDAYYGTVEQQGRLTLHLHLVLWIVNNLTPAEIRSRLTSDDSEFQRKIIEYLESICSGQFSTGTMDEVRMKVKMEEEASSIDPIQSLPQRITLACRQTCGTCPKCVENQKWWDDFPSITDHILCKSNIHTCSEISCSKNKLKSCKARFPRRLVPQTQILPDGAIELRKDEEYLNTFTPMISYLLRGNTDVTCLLSGTAIKSVIMYVTDYITKSPLKSHVLLESARNILFGLPQMINKTGDEDKTKAMLLKTVNSMTSQLEIGSPLACSYLLGFPDHYTSHAFVPFYWKSYIPLVDSSFEQQDESAALDEQQVIVMKSGNTLVPYSNVLDYVYRPSECESCSLYDWHRKYKKGYVSKAEKDENNDDGSCESDEEIDEQFDETIEDDEDEGHLRRTGRRRFHTQKFLDGTAQQEELSFLDDTGDFNKEKKVTLFKFLPQHPQYSTRVVREIEENKTPVPNFVHYPPRRTSDEPEFYYKTMLMFFKPWRKGGDLKSTNDNWADAFHEHRFSEREERMMKFFEIKYECLDSKDDYYAQRRRDRNKSSLDDDCDEEDLLRDAQAHFNDVADGLMDQNHMNALNEDNLVSIRKKFEDGLRDNMALILENCGWSSPLSKTETPLLPPDRLPLAMDMLNENWNDMLDRERKKILATISCGYHSSSGCASSPTTSWHIQGDVRILDIFDVFSKKYVSFIYHQNGTRVNAVDIVAEKFLLNREQKRAFRIIAEHSANETISEQLLMCIAGPAGTGKSQIIKAVLDLFQLKNQRFKIRCVAPTGSAAALIGGSTYHSFLGIISTIAEDSPRSLSKKAQVEIRERLKGVRYIFLDEVSMVSSQDLYKISERLSVLMNERQLPFGGVNMIFAGDFAQLPPPFGTPLYHVPTGVGIRAQQGTIGKALWEQVNTVVVLKQNMRQKNSNEDDGNLRKALDNMRFGRCDDADISFLRSLVAGKSPQKRSMGCQKFRYASIITARNIHRDYINQRGADIFSQQTKQPLHFFYAYDNPVGAKASSKMSPLTTSLSDEERLALWNMDPSKSKNLPGRLPLCRGMPVMIRRNLATECGVTNGADGIVVDWISSPMPGESPLAENKRTLSTLFVKLTNPPKKVVIGNLPENVVPVPSATETVPCEFMSGEIRNIRRTQVYVTLNFAMTDYNSQGRTRTINPVHLVHCKSHQAIYTALSRGTSAEGTILLSEFDKYKIQSGISGFLRQEFRYLEVLDEITRRVYDENMKITMSLRTRGSLINSFFDSFPEFTRENLHPELTWKSKRNFYGLLKQLEISRLKECEGQFEFANAHDKRRPFSSLDDRFDDRNSKRDEKKRRVLDPSDWRPMSLQPIVSFSEFNTSPTNTITGSIDPLRLHLSYTKPRGVVWSNWSCAYDSILPIFYNVWLNDENAWNENASTSLFYRLSWLSHQFHLVKIGSHTFESIRDNVRNDLHRTSPSFFPVGPIGTGVHYVAQELLRSNEPLLIKNSTCTTCNSRVASPVMTSFVDMEPPVFEFTMFSRSPSSSAPTVQSWLSYYFRSTYVRCFACSSIIESEVCNSQVVRNPYLIGVRILSSHMLINLNISLPGQNERTLRYKLRGIVYHGNNHYTSSIIDMNNYVWHGDGMQNQGSYSFRSLLSTMTQNDLFRIEDKASTNPNLRRTLQVSKTAGAGFCHVTFDSHERRRASVTKDP